MYWGARSWVSEEMFFASRTSPQNGLVVCWLLRGQQWATVLWTQAGWRGHKDSPLLAQSSSVLAQAASLWATEDTELISIPRETTIQFDGVDLPPLLPLTVGSAPPALYSQARLPSPAAVGAPASAQGSLL